MNKFSKVQVEQAETTIRQKWYKYLKDKGVEEPGHYIIPLSVLYRNGLGNPMSQQKLTDICKKLGYNYDRQIRHLAQKGWYLVTGRDHYTRKYIEFDPNIGASNICLKSVEEVNPLANIQTEA